MALLLQISRYRRKPRCCRTQLADTFLEGVYSAMDSNANQEADE